MRVMNYVSKDVLLKKEMIGEELTGDEEQELNLLNAKILTFYALNNWILRLYIIQRNPDILSDRAWAIIQIYRSSNLRNLTEKLNVVERPEELIDDGNQFIKLCRETSFENVRKITISRELGVEWIVVI